MSFLTRRDAVGMLSRACQGSEIATTKQSSAGSPSVTPSSQPPSQFVDRRDRKRAKVARNKENKLKQLTVTVSGKEFPANPETTAFVEVTQSAVNAGLTLPAGFSFRTVTGQKINIDATQLRQY